MADWLDILRDGIGHRGRDRNRDGERYRDGDSNRKQEAEIGVG